MLIGRIPDTKHFFAWGSWGGAPQGYKNQFLSPAKTHPKVVSKYFGEHLTSKRCNQKPISIDEKHLQVPEKLKRWTPDLNFFSHGWLYGWSTNPPLTYPPPEIRPY